MLLPKQQGVNGFKRLFGVDLLRFHPNNSVFLTTFEQVANIRLNSIDCSCCH